MKISLSGKRYSNGVTWLFATGMLVTVCSGVYISGLYRKIVMNMKYGDDPAYKHVTHLNAIQQARSRVRQRPDSAEFHRQLAALLTPAAEAVSEYEAAVRLTPRNASGYRDLGNAYMLQGAHSKAVRAFQRSVELRPEAFTYLDLGGAYAYLNQPRKTLVAYQRAYRLNKSDLYTEYMLGSGYYSAGYVQKARQVWKGVAEKNNGKGYYQDMAKEWLRETK